MKSRLITLFTAGALTCAGLLLHTQSSTAAVIADDSFESYPPGNLSGQSGGNGWSGAWILGTGDNQVTDTSGNPLEITPSGGTLISGGARAVSARSTGNNVTCYRLLPTLPDTFYVAYLFRVTEGAWTDTDTFGMHLSDAPANTGNAIINFGTRGINGVGNMNLMIRGGTGTPVAGASVDGGPVVLGTSYYLVARFSKLDIDGNPSPTYDRAELWVNPTVTDDVDNPNGHALVQLTGTGIGTPSHLLVRKAALEAADAIEFDNLTIATSWNEVVNPSQAPIITDIAPGNLSTFWPAASGVSFEVSSIEDIELAGIGLVLNGVEVSGSLSVGGTPTSRVVTFSGLLENSLYTAQITVSNAIGISQAVVQFDTFSETSAVVIEAEDYNYDVMGECFPGAGGFFSDVGGGFQDNPPASGFDLTTGLIVLGLQPDSSRLGYVDALSIPMVDFQDANELAGSVYRGCDGAGTRVGRDVRREKYLLSNLPEYDVDQFSVGDWMNYTRTFAPNNYKVFLRVASTVAQQVQLDRVESDTSISNQTTTAQGVFLVPSTGSTNTYVYVPMTDASGLVPVSVNLSDVATIRLTALGASTTTFWNYMVLVPSGESLVPPTAGIIDPLNDATFTANANIPVSVNASDSDGSVRNVTVTAVTFNSTNVIATLTAPPFTFTWNNVNDGQYTLTALATDDDGLQGVALPIEITVGNPPAPALFVVGEVQLTSGDASVTERLNALGIPVVVVDDSDSTAADATGKRLVVVSSSVISGNVNTKFVDVAVPVIQWEAALADDFQFSAGGANLDGQTSVVITPAGAAHPLGAGLPEGLVQVRVAATQFHSASLDNLAPGAVVVAVATNDAPLIMGINTGGALNSGALAAARRVHIFLGDQGVSGLNAAGLSLFDAAVNWALDTSAPAPAIEISLAGSDVTISWPVSTSGFVLEENSNVANAAGWLPSTRAVNVLGDRNVVTITSPTGNIFFRLHKND